MKVLKLALVAAAASFAMAGAASAQDVSFNIGVTSDYVFRGVSQTMEDPAVFGGVDFSSGMFYAGAWASNVDFGDDTQAEVDLYAGVKPALGPIALDLGAVYYGYVGDDGDWATWELKAAASVPAGPVTLGTAVFWSPDATGVGTDENLYYEGNASFSPHEKVTVNLAVGKQTTDLTAGGEFEYTTANAGFAIAVTDIIGVDLRYHTSDIDACNLCGDRIAATVKATF